MPASGFLKLAEEWNKVMWNAANNPFQWCKNNLVYFLLVRSYGPKMLLISRSRAKLWCQIFVAPISRKAVKRWRKKAFMGCGLLHISLSSPETHKKMMVQEHIFSYDFLDGHDFESKYSKKGTSRIRRYRREWQTANEQRQSRFTTFGALWRRLPDGPHPSHLTCRIYVEIHPSINN